MEIILEPILEFVFSGASVVVGLVIGSVALLLIVIARRAIAHTARSRLVADPDGGWWSVRVVYGLENPVATRLTGMSLDARRRRRQRGSHDADVEQTEIWHPHRLVDAFGDFSGFAAPLVLAAAIVVVAVAAVELLIVGPVALAFLAYAAVRGRWRVEVCDPGDHTVTLRSPSLSEARRAARDAARSIASGHPVG